MDEDRNKHLLPSGKKIPEERQKRPQTGPFCGDHSCEKVVAELRRRLEATQETSGIGDWIFDAATGSVVWSRQIFRLLKRDPLSGPFTFDEYLFHYYPDDAERLLEAMDKVMTEKKKRVVFMRARLLQGKTVKHRCTLLPLADQEGEVIGINGFLQESAPNDRTARAGEACFAGARLVGVGAGDVVFRLLLPDGVCEYVSPSVQDVSGIPPREWYRKRFLIRTMVHPDWLERFDRKFNGFMNSDEPEEHIFPIVRHPGELRWIQIRASMLRECGGGVSAIEGIAIDITAKILRNQIRKRHIRQLQKTLTGARVLSGLLPICSFCKRIRDDKGLWTQIESFLTEHSGLFFTHGLCPECLEANYPEFADKNPSERAESN